MDGAVGLDELGHGQGLVEPQTLGHAVGHVELRDDGHPLPHRRADGLEHATREGGTALDAAAVLVGALVEIRAHEGAEQVVVPEVDLDGVESGLDGEARGACVVLDHPIELLECRAADEPHGGGADARGRRERLHLVGDLVGDESGVADLRGGQTPGGVHGVGEPGQAGDGVGVEHEGVAVDAAVVGDRAVGDGREGGAAAGDLGVEFDEFVADGSSRHDPFEGCRLDDAVAEGERPESGRFEHGGSRRRHAPTFDASGIVIALRL